MIPLQSEINCAKLVMDNTVDARNALVSRFFKDPDCKILLTTLEAGGVSLNLTIASYVSNSFLLFWFTMRNKKESGIVLLYLLLETRRKKEDIL